MAPTFTDDGVKLQHVMPFIAGVRTKQGFPRQSTLDCTRPQIRTYTVTRSSNQQ